MCCASKTGLLVWAIISFILAAVFIVITAVFPTIVTNLATDAVQLRSDNYDSWANFPGEHDLRVYRDYFLYNCTNTNEIYFFGAKPECIEVGPITLYENSTYVNTEFLKLPVPLDTNKQEKAVRMDYILNLLNDTEFPNYINTTMNVANQALFGLWYGAQNQAPYALAMNGLYNVWNGLVNDFIDNTLVTLTMVLADQVSSQAKFNESVATLGLTDEQIVALWVDPHYGVQAGTTQAVTSGLEHLKLCPDKTSASVAQQVAAKSEIMSYFGLSFAQFYGWQNYFCETIMSQGYPIFAVGCPTPPTDPNFRTACSYLQWSNAGITTALGLGPTIAGADPTVLGFPEISYFVSAADGLNATLHAINTTLYDAQFKTVTFSDNKFLALLNTTTEIPENSLFYFSTVRELMETGAAYNATANLTLGETTASLNLTFFKNISDTLGTTGEQTYALYQYLLRLNSITLLREDTYPDRNNAAVLGLANFASRGLEELIDGLFNSILPRTLIQITFFIENLVGGACSDVATRYFSNTTLQALVCTGPNATEIGLQSIAGSSFWVNVFMDRSAATNATLDALNITAASIDDFYSDAGGFNTNLDLLRKAIKTQYAPYCTSSHGPYCADSEIGLAQFAYSAITKNMLPELAALGIPNLNSVQELLSQLSPDQALPIPPEYSVFMDKRSQIYDYNYTTVRSGVKNGTTLFYVQEQFLTQDQETGAYSSGVWRDYLRYITLELALGGLFVKHTPHEVLYGYKEPLIETIRNTPVYQGGDPTQSETLKLVDQFAKSNLAFFTGVDAQDLTKSYAEYYGDKNIRFQAPYRLGNGTTATMVNVNPWREDVPLQGTDASTFPPLLEQDEQIWALVTDIMIPLRFDCKGVISRYGLEAFRYELDPQMLLQGSKFARNKMFYLDKYDGFANLTSQRGAKVFASQAHYFGVPNELAPMMSVIFDNQTRRQISPSVEQDQSYFYLEQTSGGQMEGYQRLLLNLFTETDPLFNMTTTKWNYMLPFVQVSRYTDLPEDKIDDLLGSLRMAKQIKSFLFAAGPVIAALLIALGIFLLVRRSRIAKPVAQYTAVP